MRQNVEVIFPVATLSVKFLALCPLIAVPVAGKLPGDSLPMTSTAGRKVGT